MKHTNWKRLGIGMGISAAAIILGCAANDEVDGFGTAEQAAVRVPAPEYVATAYGTGGSSGGSAPIILGREALFDGRRDAWEDEWPEPASNPANWDRNGAFYKATQRDRVMRKYGFQWIRSYARNSTVAFFSVNDFGRDSAGKLYLRPAIDVLEGLDEYIAAGWDLCPDAPFADQFKGGKSAAPECSGVLIDKNLILTAGHCLWTEGGPGEPQYKLKHPIQDFRVVFNHVVPYQGAQPQLEEGRDVYRVRQVLTVNFKALDFAVLQLVDALGNPADLSGTPYAPVPIWPSNVPSGSFRPVGVVGAGHYLPLKTEVERTWGWMEDAANVGISFKADIFHGNSGGPIFDVETGALIGVDHAHLDPGVNITCPADPTSTTWPGCKGKTATGGVLPQIQEKLELSPALSLAADGKSYEWRGCCNWGLHVTTSEEKAAVADVMKNAFNLEKVEDDNSMLYDHAVAVKIDAIRRAACDTIGDGTVPYSDAIDQEIREMRAEVEALKMPDGSDCDVKTPFCPSKTVLKALPSGTIPVYSDVADPRPIIAESSLCRPNQVPPTKAMTWDELPEVRAEFGRETTYHGATLEPGPGGNDYFPLPSDGTWSGLDTLYRVTVNRRTVLYADTFSGGKYLGSHNPGTDFDTVLAVWHEKEPAAPDPPVLTTAVWERVTPAYDDTNCSIGATDVDFERQSQLLAILEPDERYILMVSGSGGEYGHFNLHVQAVPASGNGVFLSSLVPAREYVDANGVAMELFRYTPFDEGTRDTSCPNDGTFDPLCVYNRVRPLACQDDDADVVGDYEFVALSCPDFDGREFSFLAHSPMSSLLTFSSDPVAGFWEGQVQHSGNGYVCSDDLEVRYFGMGRTLWGMVGSGVNIDLTNAANAYLTSGAGVRAFYGHQFLGGKNWEELGYTLSVPADANIQRRYLEE